LVGSRLQFEAEAATEALAQRRPPGAIDATAERRVNHQLHAAALVEEALQNHTLLRRHRAQRAHACARVVSQLTGRGFANFGRKLGQFSQGSLAQPGYLMRQLTAARRRFAEPKRDRGRSTLGVGDAHYPAADPQDPPGSRAELEDIAAVRLDREILVQRADQRALG